MKNIARHSLFAAVLAAALFVPAAALADGVLIGPAELGGHARVVKTRIKTERAKHPEAFAALAKLREELPELDAQKRGRLPELTRQLKALGDAAVWAMIEELAVDAKPRGKLTESAWLGWRIALLEATGMLRDARAETVLVKILESDLAEPALVKAATESVARLGTDTAADKLVALAKGASDERTSILEGMGHCRREVVADFLAGELAGASDAETVLALARALGDVGSALAWNTSAVQAAGGSEETAVRTAAAKALVAAYAGVPEEARARVAQAVLVVDHTSTPTFIREAKKNASSSGQELLDGLLLRFQNSPLAKTR